MRCQACQTENRGDAAFCRACGQPLPSTCPACGRTLQADGAFCDGCGRRLDSDVVDPAEADRTPPAPPPHLAARILRDRALLEGERRTVTVLFVDAVGSVSVGEKMPQEELHRIVHRCTELMCEAVHRYEGTVAHFRGDGIMALFGAPIAHEDAARRAVAAALAMRESLQAYDGELRAHGGKGFNYRIGLNSGPVVVGRIGDDLSMDYTAIGDTVNLASRMEQWAPAWKIYVTDATRRLAPGYFDFKDLGLLEVKGKSESVRAFEVERELPTRTRLDAAIDRGLTPYVGRERELSVLRGHFEQATSGLGQVVFISGEAGIGKSRLLLEFRNSIEGDEITWLNGQCISYGRGIPYLPIVDLLKRNFGVEEGDDAATIIRRVDERAASWDEQTKHAAPYVKFLLNVDPGDERVASMDPMERRPGVLGALRSLLARGSSQRPVVMVIEDLHWIDEKSEEAIAALVEVASAARVLVLLTYRPGYVPSLGDRPNYSRLALQQLPADESSRLLESVLSVERCPRDIAHLVTSKAEGNPFYIEEVTKALLETGALRRRNGSLELTRSAGDVYVPATIQEVILTRIDRLQSDAREAIQLASVIGREFTARLLSRISLAQVRLEGVLAELKNLELIYEKAYFPELSYMFKHALTHDVAYSTLLDERKKALHSIVAASVEELYADRLAEHYETLAHHYERAQEWPKAYQFLMAAGDKAREAFANSDAIGYFTRALDAATHLGEDSSIAQFDAALGRASIHSAIGEFSSAIADFHFAGELADSAGDSHRRGVALVKKGWNQGFAHEFANAETTFRQAIEIADSAEDEDRELQFLAHMYFGAMLTWIGRRTQSDEHFATALRYGALVDNPEAHALRAMYDAELLHWRSRFEDGIPATEESIARAQLVPDLFARVSAVWLHGLLLAHAGEHERAIRTFEGVIELCERTGEKLFPMRSLNCIGWVYWELENHERALEQNRRSVEAAAAIDLPDPEVEMNARLNIADSLLVLGRWDEAAEQLAIVGRVVYEPTEPDLWMLWRYSQHYFHSLGELCLLRGNAREALRLADECLRLAEENDVGKNIVKGLRLRAQAALALGDPSSAERDLDRALALAMEIANPGQLWKTHQAYGELRSAQGRDEAARTAYRAALKVLDGMADALTNSELRTGLLESAAYTRLRAACDS
jgi:class 3 adenylate cyclase/tetratricopeptide (TPR) repeat protein